MNKFVKKLLAKYVKYIEIVGYGLVFLFIAGLVALSTIKAEDEFINLTGRYDISSSLIISPQRLFIIDVLADTFQVVGPGSDLLEVVEDERFVSDQVIRKNLEKQVEEAGEFGNTQVVRRLSAIITELNSRNYPGLHRRTLKAPISGDFVLFKNKADVVPKDTPIGGVLDFEDGQIRVTEFPADKRLKRKLKPDQVATVKLILGEEETLSQDATLTLHRDDVVVLELKGMSNEDKRIIAHYIFRHSEAISIEVSISVLVGARTWMNLIWR